MSELTINLPDPTADKLKAYLAEHAGDPAAFVAEAVEETLAKRIAWGEHMARLDKGYEDALAGRGKDAHQAMRDIKERLRLEIES